MTDGPLVGLQPAAALLRDVRDVPVPVPVLSPKPAPARARKVAAAARRALVRAQVVRKERFLTPLRSQLYRATAIHFERQQDALRRELARRGISLNEQRLREGLANDIDGILNDIFTDFKPQYAAALESTLAPAMAGAVKHRLADFSVDISFDLGHPGAQQYLKDYCAQAVTGIDETTRKSMKAIIARGELEGKSYTEIADAMVTKFGTFGEVVPQRHLRNRAEMITVHELGQAYETASRQTVGVLMDKGLPLIKYWSNTGDARVSAGCRENTAAGWISAEAPFPSGHQHGPRFPGCRCSVCYELDEARAAAKLGEPIPDLFDPDDPLSTGTGSVKLTKTSYDPSITGVGIKKNVSKPVVPGPDAPVASFGDAPPPNAPAEVVALWYNNKSKAIWKHQGAKAGMEFLATMPDSVSRALAANQVDTPAPAPVPGDYTVPGPGASFFDFGKAPPAELPTSKTVLWWKNKSLAAKKSYGVESAQNVLKSAPVWVQQALSAMDFNIVTAETAASTIVPTQPPPQPPAVGGTVPGPGASFYDFGAAPPANGTPADTVLWWKNKSLAAKKEFGVDAAKVTLLAAPPWVKDMLKAQSFDIETAATAPGPIQEPTAKEPEKPAVPGPDAPVSAFGVYPDPNLSPDDTVLWWKNKADAVGKEYGVKMGLKLLATAPEAVLKKLAADPGTPSAPPLPEIPKPVPGDRVKSVFTDPERFTIAYASHELNRHVSDLSMPGQPWCFYETDPKLSSSEKLAITKYKGIAYEDINGYCRKKLEWEQSTYRKEKIPRVAQLVREIDRAVSKSAVEGGLEVHRGLGTRPSNEVLGLDVGDVYIDRGFSSFSLASRTAYGFSDQIDTPTGDQTNVILRYITQDGEPARFVTTTENEIIYPREKRWLIVNKKEVEVDNPSPSSYDRKRKPKIKVLLVDVISDGYGAVKDNVTVI